MLPHLAALALVLAPAQEDERRGWYAAYGDHDSNVFEVVGVPGFELAEGETVHPEIDPARFTAFYTGVVFVQLDGRYRFAVEASGGGVEVSVASGDETRWEQRLPQAHQDVALTSDWLELEAGEALVKLALRRERDEDWPRLRLTWERAFEGEGGFPPEPIAPRWVTVPEAFHPHVAFGESARRGRVLLEDLGCTNCHAPDEAQRSAVGTRQGPRLDDVGARAGEDWLLPWMLLPDGFKPGARMPRLLPTDPSAMGDLLDLVAYLRARTDEAWSADEPRPARDAEGARLYHTVGCVACHGPLESAASALGDPLLPDTLPEEDPPVPFGRTAGKWNVATLAPYLRDPRRVHPDGRMPDLALTEDEAARVARYLIGTWDPPDPPAGLPPGDADAGRERFVDLGCAACHETGERLPASPPAAPLADLDASRGCLDPDDPSTPRYALTDAQRVDLAAGLASAQRASGHPAPRDHTARELDRLDCTACHARDGHGGVRDDYRPYFTVTEEVDLGDEGRIPPDLSLVGFKLASPWLRDVLRDGASARPYMAARMPRFGEDTVHGLERGLALADGSRPESDVEWPEVSGERRRVGRALAGAQGANCVQCHRFGDAALLGAGGPDLTELTGRLRYEWYRTYMQNPMRWKADTRMPALGTGGRSTFEDHLGGDALAQADALWAWFTLGDEMQAPVGVGAAAGTELVVGDRPRVFRTYMDRAGTRAVAVGTPEGLHYAFDAENVRLVEAWSGRFLDASGAWSGRGGNRSGVPGERLWANDGEPLLWVGEEEPAGGDAGGYDYLGYRLEPDGRPVFRYEAQGVTVEERLAPYPSPDVLYRRELTVTGLGEGEVLWVRAGGEKGWRLPATTNVFELPVDSVAKTPFTALDPTLPITIDLDVLR